MTQPNKVRQNAHSTFMIVWEIHLDDDDDDARPGKSTASDAL